LGLTVWGVLTCCPLHFGAVVITVQTGVGTPFSGLFPHFVDCMSGTKSGCMSSSPSLHVFCCVAYWGVVVYIGTMYGQRARRSPP
jgi:hypothetical protein